VLAGREPIFNYEFEVSDMRCCYAAGYVETMYTEACTELIAVACDADRA
jgi:hypothetical protein